MKYLSWIKTLKYKRYSSHKSIHLADILNRASFYTVLTIAILYSVLDLIGFSATSYRMTQNDEARVVNLVLDAVKEPALQGSFVEASRRLQQMVSKGYFPCAKLSVWNFSSDLCDKSFLLKNMFYQKKERISLSTGSEAIGSLTIYFDHTAYYSTLGSRIVITFGLCFFIVVFLNYLFRQFNRGILKQLKEVVTLVQSEHYDIKNSISIEEFQIVAEELKKFVNLKTENSKHKAIAQTTQIIAHDIKNPLNAAELELNKLTRENMPSQIEHIRSAIARVKHMAEKFNRADIEGLIMQNWQAIDWIKIMEEMRPIAIDAGCLLHINEYEKITTRIDADKIQRSVMNLIRNGIEADANNVWLSIKAFGTDLAIEVTDDGPGVPNEILSKLFERGVTKNKKEGTGLGLNFVKETAQGHGGDVTYCRENGKSIFRLSLPKVVRLNQEKSIEKKSIPSEKGLNAMAINIQLQEKITQEKPLPSENIASAKDISPKIAICLLDKTMEDRVYRIITEKYPSVQTTQNLDEAGYIWTNDMCTIKSCVAKKIPTQLLLKEETFEGIVDQISQKLNYLT